MLSLKRLNSRKDITTITNYKIKNIKKQLTLSDYESIIREITSFNSLNKNKKRNIGKTDFIKSLSERFDTTVSNIYKIINKSKVTVLNVKYEEVEELSAIASYNKREKRTGNRLKLDKITNFVDLIIKEVKSNKLCSIDETINYFILYDKESIVGFIILFVPKLSIIV